MDTRAPAATVNEQAPGEVETIDVRAVNKGEHRSLYAARQRIHPKKARGAFRKIKWLVMAGTLAVYYLAPWIRWDRGANMPDQAILLDLPGRRFYFFFIEIWPQEVYYVTGLLIIAALGLFLVTSIAGRVWCGYTCPQTVWTDLFIAVERFVEGDRNARIRLDRAPWKAGKIGKKLVKHAIWLVIGIGTGGAWVFYFADAPTLAGQLISFEAPTAAYLFIGILTFTTYMLAGFAREQVCTYMCPWPRIQGAMLDRDSMVVTYRDFRGEPRGNYRKGESWDDRGDCIDCNQCVAVCPMGIDIRDGQQLECISCALCIDACNDVMSKIDRPQGLIAYDTLENVERKGAGERSRVRIIRPRTIIYTGLIALVGLIMLVTLVSRADVEVNVLRDRNPLFVQLSDGSIRNGFSVKILNKRHEVQRFTLSVEGVEDAGLSVVGVAGTSDAPTLVVESDRLRSFRVYVTAPAAGGESTPLRFIVRRQGEPPVAIRDSVFRRPNS